MRAGPQSNVVRRLAFCSQDPLIKTFMSTCTFVG
jgi:hypothetical protein